MKRVAELLSRVSALLLGEEQRMEIAAKIVNDMFGADLDKKNVKFKNKTVYFEADPVLKNQIYLRKQEILENINTTSKSKYTDVSWF